MKGLGLTLLPEAESVEPVAQQCEASRHVTALRTFAGVEGSGLGVVVQTEPSQCSTRVVDGLPLASMSDPTAQQSEEPVQVTELRYRPEGLADAGVGTTDHAAPFQCSANPVLPTTLGSTPGRKLYWIGFGPSKPTAQQSVGPEQVTESNWS